MLSLLNLIIEKLNIVNSILFFSGLFLVIALLCNHYDNRALSYFFCYSSLMYTYFFLLLSLNISPSLLTYGFYFMVFISYHFYFTFSKRYYLRTIVIIRKYLNNKEYVKLVLWSYFVLFCSLIGNKFVFLGVFNPLLVYSMANSNMTFALFLIILWSWMFILIFCNDFKIYTNFLFCIQNFFSREACLHYIGNSPGKVLCEKVGKVIICTPIVVSIPALAGFGLNKESETANFAVGRMLDFKKEYPNAAQTEQYAVFKEAYNTHANSSIIGRGLTKIGIMQPPAPEAVIPNYSSELQTALSKINKK